MEDFACVPYPMATQADVDATVKLVEEVGGTIEFHHADVRNRQQMCAVAAAGVDRFGGIDIVVANAGVCPQTEDFWTISEADWDTIIDIDLKGVFNTVAAVAPGMIAAGKGGAIVVTSSLLGLKAGNHLAHYAAAKHGVLGLMKSFAVELAPHMIRCNAVCPNSVNTNMIDNESIFRLFRPDLETPTRADTVDAFRSLQVMPVPWLEPVDIANAVLFLVSDDARYITGIAVPVDLGGTLK